MRSLARSYLQHARRHMPTGSDPIPGQVTPDDFFSASYVTLTRAYTSIAPGVAQVFDLSTTGGVDTNEVPTATVGESWTGTNFAFDTSDPNYIHILKPGVYMYQVALWLGDGSSAGSSEFTVAIQETGSLYTVGADGADALTLQQLNPGFTATGIDVPDLNTNAFRTSTYYFRSGVSYPAKRGVTFAHNNASSLPVEVTLVLLKIAD